MSIVLELLHFELALSFDPRHYSAGSVERDVNILMKLERWLFKEDPLISEPSHAFLRASELKLSMVLSISI